MVGTVRGAVATAVNVLVWWGLLFLLYVILISSVPPLELMVGAGFALLGAIAAEAMRRAEHPALRGGRRIGAAAAAFPLTLIRETGQLTAAVAGALRGRGTPGSVVTIRLAPGTDAALASVLLSASPGACVIDVEEISRDPAARTTPVGHDLTVHVLGDSASRVERALGGRRLG
jgi:multisubunit Na+/H+ antiporter MnhE subunit